MRRALPCLLFLAGCVDQLGGSLDDEGSGCIPLGMKEGCSGAPEGSPYQDGCGNELLCTGCQTREQYCAARRLDSHAQEPCGGVYDCTCGGERVDCADHPEGGSFTNTCGDDVSCACGSGYPLPGVPPTCGTPCAAEHPGFCAVPVDGPRPQARAYAGLALEEEGSALLFGGHDSRTDGSWQTLGDTWRLTLELEGAAPTARFTRLAQGDESPPARTQHTLIRHPGRRSVVLLGGWQGPFPAGAQPPPLEDLWEWDGTQWRSLDPTGGPTGRYGMAATAEGDSLLIFTGGLTQGVDGGAPMELADPSLWIWGADPVTPSFSTVGWRVSGRVGAAAALSRSGSLLAIGGVLFANGEASGPPGSSILTKGGFEVTGSGDVRIASGNGESLAEPRAFCTAVLLEEQQETLLLGGFRGTVLAPEPRSSVRRWSGADQKWPAIDVGVEPPDHEGIAFLRLPGVGIVAFGGLDRSPQDPTFTQQYLDEVYLLPEARLTELFP